MTQTFMLDAVFDPGARVTTAPEATSLIQFMRRAKPGAKRFFVGGETLGRLSEIFTSLGTDELNRQRRFVKPPFEQTYVEFDVDNYIVPNHRNASRVGVVVNESECVILFGGTADPIHFNGNDGIMIGSGVMFHEMQQGISTALKGASAETVKANAQAEFFFANITAILFLLLLRPGSTASVRVPGKQKVVAGKLRPYRAHSVLSVKLSATEGRKVIVANGSRGPNREHEVRGTWVHLNLDRNCEHKWEKLERENGPERFDCQHCDAIRVWRKAHVRGDATLGNKFHTYEVVP